MDADDDDDNDDHGQHVIARHAGELTRYKLQAYLN
jgi:hypothetical protein